MKKPLTQRPTGCPLAHCCICKICTIFLPFFAFQYFVYEDSVHKICTSKPGKGIFMGHRVLTWLLIISEHQHLKVWPVEWVSNTVFKHISLSNTKIHICHYLQNNHICCCHRWERIKHRRHRYRNY